MWKVNMAPVWAVSALAGAGVGLVAWSGSMVGLLIAPALVLIWRRSGNRATAFVAALAYYLAAGRGVVNGAGVFFGELGALPSTAAGLALWFGYSVLLATVWASLWGANHRGLRLLAIMCVISIPPVGIIGGFNPLLASGAYFPGLGWIGLALACAALFSIAAASRGLAALPFAAIAVAANFLYVDPTAPNWTAVNTSLGSAKDISAQYDNMVVLQQLVLARSKAAEPGTVFVLPELVGGDWSLNELRWNTVRAQLQSRRQTVLVGVYIPDDTGPFYENTIASIGHENGITVPERIPVPIAMWKPWSGEGARARWTDPAGRTVAGRRTATLICYEQLLVWPALLSFSDGPEILIGPSNDWWAKRTSIPAIQAESFRSWARLFGVPHVWASNI
jgi:hypothetical protein